MAELFHILYDDSVWLQKWALRAKLAVPSPKDNGTHKVTKAISSCSGPGTEFVWVQCYCRPNTSKVI